MDEKLTPRHFLGANSAGGFASLYDGFTDPERGEFLYVIKGGPGCGKSSFMGRIGAAAEKEGLEVEYILCSGDPGSLDGVRIPALSTAYVDGTAPHVQEAHFPGAASMYLDLGRFYNTEALRRHRAEIMDINHRYKALYSAAYGRISAAASLLPRNQPGLWGDGEKEKMTKKLRAFAARELRGSGQGRIFRRFICAASCQGRVFLAQSLSGRVCVLDNQLGMAHFYLSGLMDEARQRGLDIIVYHDSLQPELLSGLAFPGIDLALIAPEPGTEYTGEIYRHIRLDAMADRESLAENRLSLRSAKKLSRGLLSSATETLAQAKALHDELEAIYNPHVDFSGVYSEAEAHIRSLLGK